MRKQRAKSLCLHCFLQKMQVIFYRENRVFFSV